MDLYDRLQEILKEKKISKRKLCLDLYIPYTTFANMFQRRSKSISVETLKKIATYLDTTIEYLASGNQAYRYPNNSDYFSNNTIIAVQDWNTKTYYKLSQQDFETIVNILQKFKKDE